MKCRDWRPPVPEDDENMNAKPESGNAGNGKDSPAEHKRTNTNPFLRDVLNLPLDTIVKWYIPFSKKTPDKG